MEQYFLTVYQIRNERKMEVMAMAEAGKVIWSEQEKEDLHDTFCRISKGKASISIEVS